MEVEKEIWRNISGCPGYQVSSIGRVKSMERKVKKWNGYRTVRERILKPGKNRGGYLIVFLYKEEKRKTMLLHRLVADAFLPNPNNLPQVNHKDENPLNNNVENLEFCDAKYNSNFGTRTERIAKALTGVYNTKNSKAVMQIETGKIFPSTMEVQRQLGFDNDKISKCCNGKLKSAYKYHWKYV